MHQQPRHTRSAAHTKTLAAHRPSSTRRKPTRRHPGRHLRRRARWRTAALVGVVSLLSGLVVAAGLAAFDLAFGDTESAEADIDDNSAPAAAVGEGATTTTSPPVSVEDSTLSALVSTLAGLGPQGMPQGAPGRTWHRRPEPELDLAGPISRSTAPLPPDLTAERWVVLDAQSGAVLAGHNEHQQAAMASTIKVLTALTVRRLTTLDETVTVDDEADAVGERGLWLAAGEKHAVDDLLAGMLVGSANDAATALAKHVGGTIPKWADIANYLAYRFGARDTNVVNPHGLDAEGHVSTAYDLGVLARVALADPKIADLVRTRRYEVPWPGHEFPRVAWNKNRLLDEYPGSIGVKTGGTNQAGATLVSAAERDGERYIAVVMKSWDATGESMRLLDWAFANHDRVVVADAGDEIETDDGDTVVADEDLGVIVPVQARDAIGTERKGSEIVATFDDAVLGIAETRS